MLVKASANKSLRNQVISITNIAGRTRQRVWLGACCKIDMRAFLLFLVIAGLGGLFLFQKGTEKDTASKEKITQPAAPRQTYEHDWAKHSLDTTNSVIQK